MKSTLTALLASTALAGAVEIHINQDTPTLLDFTILWGNPIADWSNQATGAGGSVVKWLGRTGRNPNFYFIEVDALCNPAINGFSLSFWTDPEYYGHVPTEYGSPNITLMIPDKPAMFPLESSLYGARFVYTDLGGLAVPDEGNGVLLLTLGLVGMATAVLLERREV